LWEGPGLKGSDPSTISGRKGRKEKRTAKIGYTSVKEHRINGEVVVGWTQPKRPKFRLEKNLEINDSRLDGVKAKKRGWRLTSSQFSVSRNKLNIGGEGSSCAVKKEKSQPKALGKPKREEKRRRERKGIIICGSTGLKCQNVG